VAALDGKSGLVYKVQTMAGEAVEAQKSEFQLDHDATRAAAARLYGLGHSRREIAVAMVDYLSPNGHGRALSDRLVLARRKLRGWEKQKSFRDQIWELGLIRTDLQTGDILNGLVQKAKRGRVDAAKLALELTGRYTPKSEQQPTQVAVVFTGISRAPAQAELVEADPEEDV